MAEITDLAETVVEDTAEIEMEDQGGLVEEERAKMNLELAAVNLEQV